MDTGKYLGFMKEEGAGAWREKRNKRLGRDRKIKEKEEKRKKMGFERCVHSRVNDDIKVGGGYFEGAKKEKSHKRMKKKKRTPIKVLQVGIFILDIFFS